MKKSREIGNIFNPIRAELYLSTLWLQGLMPYGQIDEKSNQINLIQYRGAVI